MSLRDLARKACIKTRIPKEANPETEWDLKEDIIMLGQEIEGLNQQVRDLSENNDHLRAENEALKDERSRLESHLQFFKMINQKVSRASNYESYIGF